MGDHPRLRGEQVLARRVGIGRVGSPPLARGTVPQTASSRSNHGITPACAGNSALCFILPPARRDHPRLRGEQKTTCSCARSVMGSPPLARGTVVARRNGRPDGGITPACAGNSFWCLVATAGRRDHPRLRGEQISINNVNDRCEGSPPLARGTERNAKPPHAHAGITPACAGNSRLAGRLLLNAEDHPRLRGEQVLGRFYAGGYQGSPPLARGTEKFESDQCNHAGITPACAGNSP